MGKHVTSVRMEDLTLKELELSVQWEHWESGVEIVAVILGQSEDIKSLLSEVTLDTLAEEILESEASWENHNG